MPQDEGKKKSKWGEPVEPVVLAARRCEWGEPVEPVVLAARRCEWGEQTTEGHLSQRDLEETAAYLHSLFCSFV
jgi:hypothetical protein